jgi:ATP-dependent Lon protease
MAAQRAGIETVLIPSENVEDLEDVAEEVIDSLRIVPVTQIFEVLDLVLQ